MCLQFCFCCRKFFRARKVQSFRGHKTVCAGKKLCKTKVFLKNLQRFLADSTKKFQSVFMRQVNRFRLALKL